MVYSIRKNGNKYKVYDEGRKTLASFDTKDQALAWTTKPSTIDFTQAFKLFNENIDNQVNTGIIKTYRTKIPRNRFPAHRNLILTFQLTHIDTRNSLTTTCKALYGGFRTIFIVSQNLQRCYCGL